MLTRHVADPTGSATMTFVNTDTDRETRSEDGAEGDFFTVRESDDDRQTATGKMCCNHG